VSEITFFINSSYKIIVVKHLIREFFNSHPSQKIILKITIDAEKIPTTKIIKKV